jgi:hypothetical protein
MATLQSLATAGNIYDEKHRRIPLRDWQTFQRKEERITLRHNLSCYRTAAEKSKLQGAGEFR